MEKGSTLIFPLDPGQSVKRVILGKSHDLLQKKIWPQPNYGILCQGQHCPTDEETILSGIPGAL